MTRTVIHILILAMFHGIEPTAVFATQAHGAPEGLYAHQIAHVLFCGSMAILVYWLRSKRLVNQAGWRYIQYSAVLFILWNLDAFVAHLLDEHLRIVQFERLDTFHIKVVTEKGYEWLGFVYYAAKMDHLLCVPAVVFLYSGLKRLRAETENAPETGEIT